MPTTYRTFAFIDSQNLNLGVRSSGWRIDYRKFRLYLKNKYNVERAFMFIGLVSNQQKLYTELQAAGFILNKVKYPESLHESILRPFIPYVSEIFSLSDHCIGTL